MKTQETKIDVSGLDDLINRIYLQLSGMGLYYHLANGEIDIEELIIDIDSPLPRNFPCTVTVTCVYDVDVDIYLEVL